MSEVVLGYACTWTSLAELSPPLRPHHFHSFLARGLGVPIMHGHVPYISSHGVQGSAGAAREWHADGYGLLVLVELDGTELGVALAAGAGSGLLGFSVRLAYAHWGLTVGEVDIRELSLTPEPADPGAVVLAVADEARRLWALRDSIPGAAPHDLASAMRSG